jgi:acyl-CoA thioesterase-2
MDNLSAAGTGADAAGAGGELAEEILGLLRLEALEVDMFRGRAMPGEARRLFGGQVAAQALAAAGNTVAADDSGAGARPHSLHAYFLRPGDSSAPVVFQVDRLHEGRTFRRRRVTAIQHGQPILCLESSFTADTSDATDYDPAPPVPAPEECDAYDPGAHLARRGQLRPWQLFEARPVPFPGPDGDSAPAPVRPATADMWFRLLADPAAPGIMPETVITYLSDMTLSATALRPSRSHPEGRRDVTGLTSLDHSVWFHNPADLSGWLLFSKIAPAAGPVRGLTAGQIFHRDGTLIASVAQEALTHRHGPGQS